MMRTPALCAAAAAALLLGACRQHAHTIAVTNDSDLDRTAEIVEVPLASIPVAQPFRIVGGADAPEVPYQITYDSLLIFPATVAARMSAVYTIVPGEPAAQDTIAWGRLFPERKDDMAWENDRSAYRAYGPALQASGERAFGYDIWTKCVPFRVLEKRMADDIERGISFHVDHGEGMDVYAVGPTLGGGTAALLDSAGTILYPWGFSGYEVLDRGPLRFTVRLTYPDSTRESRIISLDAGSWLNRTTVRYDGALPADASVAPGIVVHRQNPEGYTFGEGYMAYADSTENASAGNGVIFVGVVAPQADDFVYSPLAEPAGDAIGHILARSPYTAGTDYTYWWGSAWSKGGMPDAAAWNETIADFSARLANPLKVEVK